MENGRPSRPGASQVAISRAKINWIPRSRRDRCTYLEIKKRGDFNLLVYLLPGEEDKDFELQDVTRENCKLRSIED